MSWTIYKKNGEVRTVTLPLGASSRSGRLSLPDLEYNGEWMGETSVTLNVRCAVPVGFEIGDYIMYRGEKFVINYDPTVIKKARSGAYGEGFTYDNVKFMSLGYELTDVRMLDYVLNDNEIHYSSLPKFSFFCNNIDDFADRLQVNADRYCSANGITGEERWVFVTPDLTRTLQRCGQDSGLRAKAQSLYTEYFGSSAAATSDEKVNQNVSIDNQSVWDAMKNIKDVFGLNFIQKGRNVVIGAAGLPTMDIFRYGKGNGLYEIERTADEDQQIITKLFAYGSDKNLPTRYYANLNLQVSAHVSDVERSSTQEHFIQFHLDLPFDKKYFTLRSKTQPGDDQYPNYIIRVTANGKTIKGFVTLEGDTGECRIYSEYKGEQDDDRYEPDATTLDAFISALSTGDTVVFASGVEKGAFPAANKSYSAQTLPNNMAVNVLMLPGFPNKSLFEWVTTTGGGTVLDSATGKASWTHNGVTHTAYFSKDASQPYILSENYPVLGIREATKYFNGSDGDEEIFPTIENTGKDTILGATVISDNGIFADGAEIPTFKITLPDFGSDFDLSTLLQSDTVIAMKNGYCGGREFSVESVEKLGNGTWECTCQRAQDSDLDLYFPYNHNFPTPQSNLPYQLRQGDKYVLTGIEMTETYVEYASVTLLEAALIFLEKNDYTRYTYSPKVDEIFMARQHDGYSSGDTATYGDRSYHDTLKEGDLMHFADEDLGIEGLVFIDVLRIKEYGNGQIPTYEVTLRNDKQVGTIQRLQEKVNSLATGGFVVSGGGGGGGNVNIPQVRQLIQTYGKEWFLSKTGDDAANGLITFLNGIQIGAESAWGYVKEVAGNVKAWFANLYADYLEPTVMKVVDKILGPLNVEGNLFVREDDGGHGGNVTIDGTLTAENGHFSGDVTTKNLTVTGLAHFFELMIDKLRSSGGAFVFTPADGFTVEDVDGTTIDGIACKTLWWRATDGETETDNQWLVGDQAICMSFNLARQRAGNVMQNVDNKQFWSVVCRKGTVEHAYSADDIALSHYITIYSGVNESTPMRNDSDNKPLWEGAPYDVAVGDDIAMLGHRMQSAEERASADMKARQSAVYITAYASYDTGLTPPLMAFYKGVDDFDLGSHRGTYMDANGSEFKGRFLSTSSNQDGIDLETLLSGNEFEIIYGYGNPNTASGPHASWSDAEKEQRVGWLYFDLNLEPASEGGRLWRWQEVEEGSTPSYNGYAWVSVNDIDSLAALDKIADVASDGKLTGGAEKTRVYLEWMDAAKTFDSLHAQGVTAGFSGDLSDETYKTGATYGNAIADFETAFMQITEYLNSGTLVTVYSEWTRPSVPAWISPNDSQVGINVTTELTPTTLGSGAVTYRTLWSNFYNGVVEMTRALNAAQYKAIDEMGDDGLIDPAEKATLRQIFNDEVIAYWKRYDQSDGLESHLPQEEIAKLWTADGNMQSAFNQLGSYLSGKAATERTTGQGDWYIAQPLPWSLAASMRNGLQDPPQSGTAPANIYPLWLQKLNDTESTVVQNDVWDYFWEQFTRAKQTHIDAIEAARQYQIEHIDVELSERYETDNTDGSNTMPGSPTTKAIEEGDVWFEAVRLHNPAISDNSEAGYWVTEDSNGQPLYNVYECIEGYNTVVTYGNRFSKWRLVSQAVYAYFDNDGSSIKSAVFADDRYTLVKQTSESIQSTVNAMNLATKNLLVNANFSNVSGSTLMNFEGYGTNSFSRESISDLSGFYYAAKVEITSSGSGKGMRMTSNLQPFIVLEDGKDYTLSAWLKKSSSTGTCKVQVRRGSTTTSVGDMTVIGSSSTTLTTSWQRFSLTFTGNGLGSTLFMSLLSGSSNATGTFYIAGIQLEAGSSATAWEKGNSSLINMQSQITQTATEVSSKVSAGDLATEINQQAGSITAFVKKDGVASCGLKIDGTNDTTTLYGDKVIIDGDLDVRGLTSENVAEVVHDSSTPTIVNMGVVDSSISNPTIIKSVSVKPVNVAWSDNSSLSTGPHVVVLPFWDSIWNSTNSQWKNLRNNIITSFNVQNDGGFLLRSVGTGENLTNVKVVPWKESGTRLSIHSGVDNYMVNWESISSYSPDSYFIAWYLNHAVIVCADGRGICKENANSSVSSRLKLKNNGYYSDTSIYQSGLFSCGGTVARFIVLMPGQSLQLRSEIRKWSNRDTLIWVVENSSDFTTITNSMKIVVDSTNSLSCEGTAVAYDPTTASQSNRDALLGHPVFNNSIFNNKEFHISGFYQE